MLQVKEAGSRFRSQPVRGVQLSTPLILLLKKQPIIKVYTIMANFYLNQYRGIQQGQKGLITEILENKGFLFSISQEGGLLYCKVVRSYFTPDNPTVSQSGGPIPFTNSKDNLVLSFLEAFLAPLPDFLVRGEGEAKEKEEILYEGDKEDPAHPADVEEEEE